MRRELPVRPNLDHLKSQAKDLLEAFRRQERDALARVLASLPSAHGASFEKVAALEFALHDAQSVIAREYGFASFTELRQYVERAAQAANLTPEALKALLERHAKTPLPKEVEEALLAASQAPPPRVDLPPELPVVPVRNTLLSVGAIAPLHLGRASSLAALSAAQRGGGLLATFGQKDELNETPQEQDLHPVGCAVVLCAVIPHGDGTSIVVRATHWIQLDELTSRSPYLSAKVSPFAVDEAQTEHAKELERELRQRVRAIVSNMPGAAQLLQMTERMRPLELADATIANLKCSVEAKALYATQPTLTQRLEYVLKLLETAA
jgi:Lon protease-like protein